MHHRSVAAWLLGLALPLWGCGQTSPSASLSNAASGSGGRSDSLYAGGASAMAGAEAFDGGGGFGGALNDAGGAGSLSSPGASGGSAGATTANGSAVMSVGGGTSTSAAGSVALVGGSSPGGSGVGGGSAASAGIAGKIGGDGGTESSSAGASSIVPDGACAVERDCEGFGYVCRIPGTPNCGGPRPPPDECATDEECSLDLSRICEPTGYCGQRQCVDGCRSGQGCQVFESCGASGRCEPALCASGTDCGGNHGCAGHVACTRRSCSSSVECDGFCVDSLCFAEPGRCENAMAP